MKRVIQILVSITVMLVTVCLTQETQVLKVSGLRDEVIIRRDNRAISYIEAQNEDDLYFAQGFITASDRLWQMDLLRRLARGETAEIFGRSALANDKYWRRYGFARVAEESFNLMDEKLKRTIENYSRGVNSYIASLDDASLPIEFRILQYKPSPWKPSDSIVIGKILAEALSSSWNQDILYARLKKSLSREKFSDITNTVTKYDVVLFGKDEEKISREFGSDTKFLSKLEVQTSEKLLEELEKQLQIRQHSLEMVGLYVEGLAASNNWVVSGKRTLDGRPIIANDPHLPPSAPSIWYLIHLSLPDGRVSGVTFPGVPGVILGHNEFIAWGATNVGPDVQDLYEENFNQQGEYETPNGWAVPVIRREEIKVRKSPFSKEFDTEVIEFTETRNGVIILEDQNKKYALKWTALDPKNSEFEAFYYLNRARNWEEFKSALSKYGGPMQNFVYADIKGNIGWYAAGRVPIRRSGTGIEPYKGSETAGDWIGYIPFDELPNLYNPREGLIVTANQRIVGTNYKYQQLVREIAAPWRARRIYDLLRANSKLTMNDMRDIQHDVFNIPLVSLVREIIKLSGASEQTLMLFRGWDGKMTADSQAAVFANHIYNCLAEKIAADNKPLTLPIVRERVLWKIIEEKPSYWLPQGFKNYKEFFKACDLQAQQELEKKIGNNRTQWTWGRVYVATFPHPLALINDPFGISKRFALSFTNVNGSPQTPNVGASVSMRFIASPGNWDETRQVIALGQSGDPQSPFWKDQFEAWRTGLPQVFPFTQDAVQKATREYLRLLPLEN